MLHELIVALSGVSGSIFVNKKDQGFQVRASSSSVVDLFWLYYLTNWLYFLVFTLAVFGNSYCVRYYYFSTGCQWLAVSSSKWIRNLKSLMQVGIILSPFWNFYKISQLFIANKIIEWRGFVFITRNLMHYVLYIVISLLQIGIIKWVISNLVPPSNPQAFDERWAPLVGIWCILSMTPNCNFYEYWVCFLCLI